VILNITWRQTTNAIVCGTTNDNSAFIIYGGTEHYLAPNS